MKAYLFQSPPPGGQARRTSPPVRRAGPLALCLLAFALFGARGEQAGQASPSPVQTDPSSPQTRPSPAQTGQSPVQAELTLSRKDLFVGEPVEGRLVLRWRPPVTVHDPVLSERDLGGFQILDQSSSPDESLADGSIQRTISLKLTTFDIGERPLGPIEVACSDAQGRPATVQAPAQKVQVVSYLEYLESKGRKPDVCPIKPPLVWPGPSRWLLAGLGAGALALLLATAWIVRRLRSRRGEEAVVETLPSPEEEALQALAQVEASGMIDREASKVFYSRLSEILRRYLGRRYGFDALEMTSSELLGRAERLDWPEDLLQILASDTTEADSVKFARYEPVRPRRLGALGRVRQIVETTRPRELTDRTDRTDRSNGSDRSNLSYSTDPSDQARPAAQAREARSPKP